MPKTSKILVVDDNRVMRTFVANLLQKEGHEVFVAHDGFAALKIIFRERPEILFLDLFMPKIGGDLLCRMVRKMPHMVSCYIVIISAAMAEAEIDYRVLGADAHIPKGPFAAMSKYILAAVRTARAREEGDDPEGPADIVCGDDLPLRPRQITRELISRNRHWENLLDSMGDGVLELMATTVIYANDGALELFGLEPEDIIAANFIQLFDVSDHRRLAALIAPATRGKADIAANAPLFHEGRQLALRAHTVKGGQASCIVVISDVTRQNHLQFQECHNRKMRAVCELAGSACKSLRKRIQHREAVQEGSMEAPKAGSGIDSPPAVPLQELHSLYREMSRIARSAAAGPAEGVGWFRNGRETILLADSDTLIGGLNRNLLEELGYTVLMARTAGSALFKFRARCHKPYLHVQAVIVNHRLPGLDLSGFLDEVLHLDPDARILMAVESSAAVEDAARFPGLIRGVLRSPMDPSLLSAALEAAFAIAPGEAAP